MKEVRDELARPPVKNPFDTSIRFEAFVFLETSASSSIAAGVREAHGHSDLRLGSD
jgi:hypothetical protein